MSYKAMVNELSVASEFTLKDGKRVRVRPILPSDESGLVEAFHRLSADTIYKRFFTAQRELSPAMAHHLASVDYVHRLAFVAETETDAGEELIAVARYEPSEEAGVAEFAVVVGDFWQNKGLGRILLRETLNAARGNNIHRFRADILSDNRRMLHLLASEAVISSHKTESGITQIYFERNENADHLPARC